MNTALATAEGTVAPRADDPAGAVEEAELLVRVLGALLREDVVGLRTRGTLLERPDGHWLRLPAGPAAGALLLPLAEDGYQSTYTARLPLLVRESDGARLTTLDEAVTALRDLADPADQGGFDALAEECRQTLATMRLHTRTRDEADAALTSRHGSDPGAWQGLAGGLGYDTLAARTDHPVYPTARGRSGLDEGQLRAYAPEFRPEFALRWLALPRAAVTVPGGAAALPDCWPTPGELGLRHLDESHLALPVHPLSLGDPLHGALRRTGLEGAAVLSDRELLTAVPTLSMRTVALDADPRLHLKLPLATATLGLRNRRTIKPGTLADGAAGQRLLETVLAREPRFAAAILQADETCYAHAGDELLAVLCRRYPAGLDHSAVVPMAALLSRAPGGRLVIDHLADRFYGGDPLALLDACLTLLFDWQTTLFGYGIALESHQQNISLVLDRPPAAPGCGCCSRTTTGRASTPSACGRPWATMPRTPPASPTRGSSPGATGRCWTCSPPSPSTCARGRTPSASPGTDAPRWPSCSARSATASPRPSSGWAPGRTSRALRCAPTSWTRRSFR